MGIVYLTDPVEEERDLIFNSVLPENHSFTARSRAFLFNPTILAVILTFIVTLIVFVFFTKELGILFCVFIFSLSTFYFTFNMKDKEQEKLKRIEERKDKALAKEAKEKKEQKKKEQESIKKYLEKEMEKSVSQSLPKWSLMARGETARKRIDELTERKNKIIYVSNKINSKNKENLTSAKEKLFEADEIIDIHIGMYRLQRQKIKLAQIQNRIIPYIDKLFKLTESEAKNALEDCDYARVHLKDVEKEIPQISKFLSDKNKDSNDFAEQVKETQITIDKLEEAVFNKKVTLALEGITSIEDALDANDFGGLAHSLETFGAKSTLVDFSESFDELESEYKRMRAENEVSQKLLNQ